MKRRREATPLAFRDLLLSLASTVSTKVKEYASCPGQYLEGVCHDLAEQRWLSAPGPEAPAYWVSQ